MSEQKRTRINPESLTSKQEGDYWRSGCECNRVGMCYRCRAADEIDRLTAALKKADSNHEEFERRHYLEVNKTEDLTARNAELVRALEEARRDAERYRWLRQERYEWCRNMASTDDEQVELVALWSKQGVKNIDEAVDAAIDAALKGDATP